MQNAPFALLGVNSDQDRQAIRQIVQEKDLTWRSWWDGGIDGPIHQAWNVVARPAVYVLDADGIIRYKDVFGDELDRAVDQLIADLEETVGE